MVSVRASELRLRRAHGLWLLALAAVALPSALSAQAPEPAAPVDEVTPDAPPSVPPAPDPSDEARERFMQGLELARAGNCEGAITEFEASYTLVPRPNTLYNIAQCQEQLNRYDLAIRYYD